MNIIQVANVRWYNATAWYALRLGKLLQDAGHNSLILTIRAGEPLAHAEKMGLPVRCLDLNNKNPFQWPSLYGQLSGLVEEFKPDIVNCHRGEAFFLWGMLKARSSRFGLVRTRGDRRLPRNNLFNRRLHTNVADAVIATNTAMAKVFQDALNIPADRVWFIPGGVDREYFQFDPAGRERVRQEFGFGPNDFVVGLVGRFDLVKGQLETIKAVSELKKRGLARVRLFLIGFETDTTDAEVRQWLREYNIEDQAAISGRRPDITACLSALDLGLVASLGSEAIARAALEIMSCGRPLVSTNIGVMPDLAPESALVEPGNHLAMAEIIQKSLTDREFLAEILAEEQNNMSRWSDQAFLAKTLAVYADVLARGQAG